MDGKTAAEDVSERHLGQHLLVVRGCARVRASGDIWSRSVRNFWPTGPPLSFKPRS